jgi:hypothetical protein
MSNEKNLWDCKTIANGIAATNMKVAYSQALCDEVEVE